MEGRRRSSRLSGKFNPDDAEKPEEPNMKPTKPAAVATLTTKKDAMMDVDSPPGTVPAAEASSLFLAGEEVVGLKADRSHLLPPMIIIEYVTAVVCHCD